MINELGVALKTFFKKIDQDTGSQNVHPSDFVLWNRGPLIFTMCILIYILMLFYNDIGFNNYNICNFIVTKTYIILVLS